MTPSGSTIEVKPKPPIKWAGGKGQLLQQFEPLLPQDFRLYVEPFVGGGALFFHLLPQRAVLIDNNPELMNFYEVLRDKVELLLEDAAKHPNDKEYYYSIRAQDPCSMDPVSRASRFLYLNKTAYNGLWRVNRAGRHNVPFGRYRNPKIADAANLRQVSRALEHTELLLDDFSRAVTFAGPQVFVYLDPPYHPVSSTAYFTNYTSDSFGVEDQKRLASTFRELDERGCLVMLSNSDTPLIRELYAGYDVRVVQAKRAISCRPDGRSPVSELVIRNFS